MTNSTDAGQGCCGGNQNLNPLDVCNLPSGELSKRIEWIRKEIVPEVLGRERIEGGVAIEIADVPGMRAKVDQWIELERVCCGPLDWSSRVSPGSGSIRVEIGGVDPDGPLFGDLPLMEGESAEADLGIFRRWGRILKAGGIGAAASFFICCILPMGLVTLLGATAVAAPLAFLDDPLWIGLGAVVGGTLAWLWMARRANAS